MANINGNVRCTKCPKMFKSRSFMEQHIRDTHTAQKTTVQNATCKMLPSAQFQAGSKLPTLPEHLNRILLCQTSALFKCPCGNVNAMTLGILRQHLEDKNKTHKRYRCMICCESFDLQQAVTDHTKIKHVTHTQRVSASQRHVAGNIKKISHGLSKHLQWIFDSQTSPPFRCPCNKIYSTREHLKQHLEDKDRTHKSCRCKLCCDSFSSQEALDAHRHSKHEKTSATNSTGLPLVEGKTYYCLTCTNSFKGIKALLAHESDANHDNSDVRGDKHKSLHRYFDNYLKYRTIVDPTDGSDSFSFVYNKLRHILSKVRSQEGGDIFSNELRKAGSVATGLKVKKADEFDFNIPLEIHVREVIRSGCVPYIFADKVQRCSDKVDVYPNEIAFQTHLK